MYTRGSSVAVGILAVFSTILVGSIRDLCAQASSEHDYYLIQNSNSVKVLYCMVHGYGIMFGIIHYIMYTYVHQYTFHWPAGLDMIPEHAYVMWSRQHILSFRNPHTVLLYIQLQASISLKQKLQCELHNSWLLQTTYKGSLITSTTNISYITITCWNKYALYECMYMHVLCVVWASSPASAREGHSPKSLSAAAQCGAWALATLCAPVVYTTTQHTITAHTYTTLHTCGIACVCVHMNTRTHTTHCEVPQVEYSPVIHTLLHTPHRHSAYTYVPYPLEVSQASTLHRTTYCTCEFHKWQNTGPTH